MCPRALGVLSQACVALREAAVPGHEKWQQRFRRERAGPFSGNFALFVMQVFKRHNPSTAEEQEMMENLFDSLCSCLMLSSNRDRFLKGEGLQLMNLMLRYRITVPFSCLLLMYQQMF